MVEKRMRTLLRYPGGKSRAVKYLREYIPDDVSEICSPFFGGGALEIALAKEGVKIQAYDKFDLLVEFWQCAIESPVYLADEVSKLFPLSNDKFRELQATIYDLPSKIERAAAFYALNRSSFSGTTLSGGMSKGHPRFTESSIDRLRNFKSKNISIDVACFTESIPKNKDKFLYCDPPYYIESTLYGVKGNAHAEFDHVRLSEILKERDGWVLSYNNCDEIKELYKEYEIVYPEWRYGMNKSKKSSEILILNYG